MALKKITRGKNKGKYNVIHCHGKDKGKPINKKPMSHEKALAMHRAIEANKNRNSKWNRVKKAFRIRRK